MLLTAVLSVSAAPEEKVWSASYPLTPGGEVSVTNVQGSIVVEGWERAEVELTAVQTVAAGATEAGVGVERGPDRLTVRTLYPAENTEPVEVNYFLRVPRQARLEGLLTVNGDIQVRAVEGHVTARTLNGNIEQDGGTGSVNARALNGNIRLAMRRLPGRTGELTLETVNGDIELLLPSRAEAELEMKTVAGQIASRMLVSVSETPGDTALRAKLGRGGAAVRLRTVRGDISVNENLDVF
jgi:hypothetical protein